MRNQHGMLPLKMPLPGVGANFPTEAIILTWSSQSIVGRKPHLHHEVMSSTFSQSGRPDCRSGCQMFDNLQQSRPMAGLAEPFACRSQRRVICQAGAEGSAWYGLLHVSDEITRKA